MPPNKYCSYDSMQEPGECGQSIWAGNAETSSGKRIRYPYRSTLQDKSTGRFPLRSRLGRCTVLTTAEEKEIVERVKRMPRWGLPVKIGRYFVISTKDARRWSGPWNTLQGQETWERLDSGISQKTQGIERKWTWTDIESKTSCDGALHQGMFCHP